MKIISFSGAQSTGKTTLLNHLQEKNPSLGIVFVPEVTRLIHREYSLPINEGAGGMTQLLINAHHAENVYKKEPEHIQTKVLNRCILDGKVYTEWLARHHAHNIDMLLESVNDVSDDLFNQLITKYDVIFYTSPEGVPLKDDGERSVNETFRNEILKWFRVYVENAIQEGANIVTLKGTVEERLATIKSTVDKLGIKLNV